MQKIHTGIPFLDRMLTRQEDVYGSIPIPDPSRYKKSNILIKGEPGTGKTVMASQIALNLINKITFKENSIVKEKRQGAKKWYQQIGIGALDSNNKVFDELIPGEFIDKDKIKKSIVIPIYFSFEQPVKEIKINMEKIFEQEKASTLAISELGIELLEKNTSESFTIQYLCEHFLMRGIYDIDIDKIEIFFSEIAIMKGDLKDQISDLLKNKIFEKVKFIINTFSIVFTELSIELSILRDEYKKLYNQKDNQNKKEILDKYMEAILDVFIAKSLSNYKNTSLKDKTREEGIAEKFKEIFRKNLEKDKKKIYDYDKDEAHKIYKIFVAASKKFSTSSIEKFISEINDAKLNQQISDIFNIVTSLIEPCWDEFNKEKSDPIVYPLLVGLKTNDPRKSLSISELSSYIGLIQYKLIHSADFDAFKNDIDTRFPQLEFVTNKKIFTTIKEREKNINFAIFIDSINVFFDEGDTRSTLFSLLSLSSKYNSIMFLLLEDYCMTNKVEFLYLAKSLEFQSDIVINLRKHFDNYLKSFFEITKNRHSKVILGEHLFKILSPGHSLSNIDKRVGISLYQSIHSYFASSRNFKGHEESFYTGIAYIDKQLNGDKPDVKTLEKDAFILIAGEKSTHKLPLAFNLLIGGFLDKDTKKVMILSFQDENMIKADQIPLARKTLNEDSYKDVGEHIYKIDQNEKYENLGDKPYKVKRFKYGVKTKGNNDAEIIEISMTPGNLSEEELLFIVEMLICRYSPTRVLIDNTSLLKMRFPDIFEQKMIFPALISSLKHNGIMSILIDVTGEGSDEELSYGLCGMADYLFEVKSLNGLIDCNVLFQKYFNEKKAFDCTDSITLKTKEIISTKENDKTLKQVNDKTLKQVNENTISFFTIKTIRHNVYSSQIHAMTTIGIEEDIPELIMFQVDDFPKI